MFLSKQIIVSPLLGLMFATSALSETYRVAALQNDMNLHDQHAQYAFGQTVSGVMTNLDRDVSEITTAAARSGMDVIFGESHDVISETMKQISTLVENVNGENIEAIVLELPTEMQELFDPDNLMAMSREEFIYQATILDYRSRLNVISTLYDHNEISEIQYAYLESILKTGQDKFIDGFQPENVGADPYGDIYDMAVKALDAGVPVVAADIGRTRWAFNVLSNSRDPDIMVSYKDYNAVYAAEMDDTSDVDYLESLGFDLDNGGILVVHRGYDHINNTERLNTDVPRTNGFDEVLESRNRNVVTFAIRSLSGERMSFGITDPADFSVTIRDGLVHLNREEYLGSEPVEEQRLSLADRFRGVFSADKEGDNTKVESSLSEGSDGSSYSLDDASLHPRL